MNDLSMSRRSFLAWSASASVCAMNLHRAFAADTSLRALPPDERMKRRELEYALIQWVEKRHIDFIGIAAPSGGKHPRIIVAAHALPDDVVDAAPEHAAAFAESLETQWRPRTTQTADALCRLLQSSGHAAETGSNEEAQTAGHLSGLGWPGKNGLLIHPGSGPRLIAGAVWTDAPLPVTCEKPMPDMCRDCTICTDACPCGAISDGAYDRETCVHWCADHVGRSVSRACGRCIAVCPFGQNGMMKK